MSGARKNGFTVIETLLFLSITGLMVVTMVVGTSSAVNNQRYIDSVRSFKSLVQEQYARLVSTENDRTSQSQNCADIVGAAGDTEDRGRSSCEIVGRYMTLDGENITLYPVVAHRTVADNNSTAGDIDKLAGITYGTDSSLIEELKLEWGAKVRQPSNNPKLDGVQELGGGSVSNARQLGVLFIRSPYSGYVYTFSSKNIPNSDDNPLRYVNSTIKPESADYNSQEGIALCIDSDGLLTRDNMFVYIQPFASSSSSVESGTDDNPPVEGLKC